MKIETELEVEHRLTAVETTLSEIKDNHLVHLASDINELGEKVDKINVKLAYWAGGIVVAISIFQLIVNHFIK